MDPLGLLRLIDERLDMPQPGSSTSPELINQWIVDGVIPELPGPDNAGETAKWRIAQSVAAAAMIWTMGRKWEDVAAARRVLGTAIESGGNVERRLHENYPTFGPQWVILTVKAYFGVDVYKPATIISNLNPQTGRYEYSIEAAQIQRLQDGTEQEYDSLFGWYDTQQGEFIG